MKFINIVQQKIKVLTILFLFSPVSLHANRGASLVARMVKNLPAMWETRARYLGWEDPLEKEIATHSNILAWKIP